MVELGKNKFPHEGKIGTHGSKTGLDAADQPAYDRNLFEKVSPRIPVVLVQNNPAGAIESDMALSDGSQGFSLFKLLWLN